MIWPIPLVDCSAARAAYACVARIDIDDGNAEPLRLIGDEASELAEGPVVQAGSLTAAGRDPATDVLEVFKRNPASGAFCGRNERLRDAVVSVAVKSPLLEGNSAEPALSGLGSAALKLGAAAGQFQSQAIDFSATVRAAVAVRGDVGNSEVNSEPVARPEAFDLGNVAGTGQHPLAAHEAQIDLALSEGEQVTLPMPGDKAYLHASGYGPDRNLVVLAEADNAIVVGLRSEPAKDWRSRAAYLEGIGYLGNAADRGLCCQIESAADIAVDEFVQVELAENIRLKTNRSQPSTGRVAAFKRSFKGVGLLARRQEFDCGNELHPSNIERNSDVSRARLAASAIPLPAEAGSLSWRYR